MPDTDDDEAQPLTLVEWIARQRRNFVLQRAKAHTELDALLDQQQARMEGDFHRVERDLHEHTRH
jgi:hypothetical protein